MNNGWNPEQPDSTDTLIRGRLAELSEGVSTDRALQTVTMRVDRRRRRNRAIWAAGTILVAAGIGGSAIGLAHNGRTKHITVLSPGPATSTSIPTTTVHPSPPIPGGTTQPDPLGAHLGPLDTTGPALPRSQVLAKAASGQRNVTREEIKKTPIGVLITAVESNGWTFPPYQLDPSEPIYVVALQCTPEFDARAHWLVQIINPANGFVLGNYWNANAGNWPSFFDSLPSEGT